MRRAFEYRHTVGFEETNLVGNVYYVHHLRWQGRCREMFLRAHAPGVLDQLRDGLALTTVSCHCEYLAELAPFDEIVIRMRLAELVQNRLVLDFEYWRQRGEGGNGDEELVARGRQEIACMSRTGNGSEPTSVPAELREALRRFM